MLVATNAQQTAQNSPKTTRSNTPIKMERRDSSSSYSSLEDLEHEGKKLNAVTSTPVVTSDATISCAVNSMTRSNQRTETDNNLHQRMQESDEANDYDEDESADEKSSQPRQQLHYKRRLSGRSLTDKTASVLLEYNADNPNSLRKKFRFNRFVLNNGDESGFVDTSNNSQMLNNSSSTLAAAATNLTNSNSVVKSNSSSETSSPPQSNGNSSPESGIGEREDMKYMCPICDAVSQTAHQFTNHIRCHNYASGHTENFTCRICSKVLSSASSLDRHVLVHTGERPFNCKYCHLTFTTNGNMHRHMRTHKQHQHTHHRRNSNGTKFNTNNNNNYNNNTTTNPAVSKTTLSNGQLSEGVKLSTTTTAADTTTSSTTVTSIAAPTSPVTAAATTATNTANAADNDCNQKATGANGKRLNGNANLESYESDGGCSSDSSAGHVSNNNNNNNDNQNNNNNNNDLKINNNYKRKHSEDHPHQDVVDAMESNHHDLLKRRLRLETNNNNNNSDTTNSPANTNEQNNDLISRITRESVVCPVCNESDFSDNMALDQHMDSKHPEIPAKCKNCDVLFRTHHQLNIHPCTADIKGSINLSVKQRRLSESSNHHNEEEDREETEDHLRQRHELFQHFKNAMAHSNSHSSHFNQDLTEDDIKSEPSAHDSKDLADIQSILNMTASSSNSNLLRNFEQSVNTPSSQYSYDRDEEEAQDAFTSEFRKMKLRGEFPCKLCPAVYPNLRALKGHNRVHLSEAGPAGPFRCNMCPYSICDKAALIRHMRTHNGDRPYECAVCNYAFTTKANCERHLRNRHAKTTREEVKRAIIYHPSEDSSCDDTNKKLHMFSSELDDDCDLMSYHQHQPKDRSTPVSHLKERLTLGESPSSKPVKIQVKNLEDLLDKSTASSGYHDSYDKRNVDTSQAPIDMSMDVLDLSKKPSAPQPPVQEEKIESSLPLLSLPKQDANLNTEVITNKVIPSEVDPKLDVTALDKQHQQLLLAQQQLLSDPNQLMQQLYRNLLFPQFPPFFMPNTFMNNNFTDFQKLAPILTRMMGGVAAATLPNNDLEKPSNLTPLNTNNSPSMPQMSPLLTEKSNPSTMASMSSPKSLHSPNPNHVSMPRHMMAPAASSHSPNLPPTMLSNGPIKMVLKNGVFMPKQKQRRYRTERPFACEHCSARFTLRSNMERHVKQQHPQYYAQRQRSGHHVMRGRGASSAANMNNITHLQAAVAQAHYGSTPPSMSSHSPISEQVKCAILAQQLKARKDTDLLQQALAHGSNSVANSNMFSQQGPNLSNGQPPFFGFNPHHNHHLSQNGTPNGSMEDDEPKLIIDEDDEEEEEDEDDVEEIHDDQDEEEEQDLVINESEDKIETRHLPTTVEEVKLKADPPQESAKKVAESILEQAIKARTVSSFAKTTDSATVTSNNNTMKSMIAQAPAVGKFLKEVASSSFKDESQDLVSVSELVDNATNNSVSFNNYFRPSDVANHMEPSDEDGLVASSASESNNSGAEDTVCTEKPKKKSAYSLAPNRVHCPYCQRMFPWSSSLRRHILTHTGQKPFKCSHCPLLFTTKSNCDRHLLRKHGDVESAVSVYVPTEDVSEPIPLPKSVEEIERMQREREEEERKRKAEEQRERLEKEQLEKQKFEQEQQQKQAFLKHLAVAQFQQQFNQKTETNAVSSSELPYKCHLCESSFAERLQCLEHIKSLHAQEFALLLSKGAIENETDSAQMTSTEEDERQRSTEDGAKGGKYPDYSNRKVICAFCMRRFWSTEDLRRHMRTHSGERPFQCEICFRKFTLKHSMLRHMKKHNGLHINGSQSNNDNLANGNSGSDYSDDEQSPNTMPTPAMPLPSTSINALLMGSKFQELLSKANEWRNGNLNALREGKENNAEETNTPQTSDLIGNLLGISDQGILNKLMSSPDEAAKFLGVDK
ncbi:zinc finger protein 236 [Lucilia cuprina]|uniref:zinc finger protein 236 n=1 Tax=Lucilia cuprina TaxID=7375 RepID=UPI001F067115|nr:zinc finger protein 236 [Lucilia cuprina]